MKKNIIMVVISLLLSGCNNMIEKEDILITKVKNLASNLDLYKLNLKASYINGDSLIITYNDSLGYFNKSLHSELVYLFGGFIIEHKLGFIKYSVILSDGEIKKYLYSDVAIKVNKKWYQEHSAYASFIKDVLKNKRNVDINFLMYSFFLENMNNGDIFENNVFNLFKLYFSNNLSDFELAESYFEIIHKELQTMSKNKEQFLFDYNLIREKLNHYGHFKLENGNGKIMDGNTQDVLE